MKSIPGRCSPTTPRHLLPDDPDLFPRKKVASLREDFGIFECDVGRVGLFEPSDRRREAFEFPRLKLAPGKPAVAELVELDVPSGHRQVVFLQPIQCVDRMCVPARPQFREERFLFVRHVSRSRFAKVSQSSAERPTLLVFERSSPGLLGHGGDDSEETLDSAVAVAE